MLMKFRRAFGRWRNLAIGTCISCPAVPTFSQDRCYTCYELPTSRACLQWLIWLLRLWNNEQQIGGQPRLCLTDTCRAIGNVQDEQDNQHDSMEILILGFLRTSLTVRLTLTNRFSRLEIGQSAQIPISKPTLM